MGKGIIKSGGTDGLYGVELTLHKDRVDASIAIIDAQIAILDTKISGMEDGDAKELEKLRRASYQKRKEYFQNNTPEDPTVAAWCGDLTEDLSGTVGTIEVPGERGIVQIQPGYEGNAAYDKTRDGQLQSAVAGTPASVFYNLAMLPGWQKWMPTYRYGIISNIDTDNDTCDVKLDTVKSSQQNLDVNQEATLTGISVEYMSCNASAFEDGDSVLVKFEGQDWSGAKVVGFVAKPKQCKVERVYVTMTVGTTDLCFVWNAAKNAYADIKLNAGGLASFPCDPASFPCDPADISDWKDDQVGVGASLYNTSDCGRRLWACGELLTGCPPSFWGTAGTCGGSKEEESNCGCGFMDIGECTFTWDLTENCSDPGDSGASNWSTSQNILWRKYAAGASQQKKLTFLNNKEGEDPIEDSFRIELQHDASELHWDCEGFNCDSPCDNSRLDSGIYSNIYKFHTPLALNILEIHHDRTKNWDECNNSGAYADTNYLVGHYLQHQGAYSEKIIVQIYTAEARTVTRSMNGAVSDYGNCCGDCTLQDVVYTTYGLKLTAQVGVFKGDAYPDGTDGIDPTGLSRNSSFESAINGMYNSLRTAESIPSNENANPTIGLSILNG